MRLFIRHPAKTTLVVLIVAGLLAVIFARSVFEQQGTTGSQTMRAHMVELTNADRSDHDRVRLALNLDISRYAKRHSEEMASRGYIFQSSDRKLSRLLAPYNWSLGGENVGVGGSLDSLETSFMHSPEHRRNILKPAYRFMAVGVFQQTDEVWVTVIFYG